MANGAKLSSMAHDASTGARATSATAPSVSDREKAGAPQGVEASRGDASFSRDGEAPALHDDELIRLRHDLARWRTGVLKETEARLPPRDEDFSTWSGIPVPDLATPLDAPVDYQKDLGFPGVFPFTRGVQPNMYRGRPWT